MTDDYLLGPKYQAALDHIEAAITQATTPAEIDLIAFSSTLGSQSTATIASALELVGNELYRRLLPTAAGNVKNVVKDLRSILRHLEETIRV